MRLLAFDPGLHHVGWSLLDPALKAAGLLTLGDLFTAAHAMLCSTSWPDADEAVVELPRVYRRSKADPDDLIRLAFFAGALSCGPWPCRVARPHDWKGNVPKVATGSWDRYVIHRRIWKLLDPHECAIYQAALDRIPARLRHNVIDAVGLGLWGVGRLGKNASV